MYVHTYIHTYVYTYVCMYVYIHTYIHSYVYTYIRIYVCIYVYIYIHVCVCVCVCVYAYTCIYLNKYNIYIVHVHTYTQCDERREASAQQRYFPGARASACWRWQGRATPALGFQLFYVSK